MAMLTWVAGLTLNYETIKRLNRHPGVVREQDTYDHVPHDQEIVFYCDCPAESESAISALKLYEKGFTNVSALLGGIDAWQEAAYPLENS